MLKIVSSSPTCNLVGSSAIRNCSESSWSRSWWQLSSLCFVAHAKSRSRIRDRTHTMPHTMPHTVPAFTCSHMRPQPCTHHTMPHTIHAFTYMFIHAIPTHSVCFFFVGGICDGTHAGAACARAVPRPRGAGRCPLEGGQEKWEKFFCATSLRAASRRSTARR